MPAFVIRNRQQHHTILIHLNMSVDVGAVVICHLQLFIRQLIIGRIENILIEGIHLQFHVACFIFAVHRKIQCHNLPCITLPKMHNMSSLIRIGLRLSVNRHLQLLTMTGLKINIHILLLRESQLPGQTSAAAMPLIIIFILTGTGQHAICHLRLSRFKRDKHRSLSIRCHSHKIILGDKRIPFHDLPLGNPRIHHVTKSKILLVLINILILCLLT